MRSTRSWLLSCVVLCLLALTLTPIRAKSEEEDDDFSVLEDDMGSFREGGRTDDNVIKREEEAIKLDGLSVSEMKQLRDSAEKKVFAAEVNRWVLQYVYVTIIGNDARLKLCTKDEFSEGQFLNWSL